MNSNDEEKKDDLPTMCTLTKKPLRHQQLGRHNAS